MKLPDDRMPGPSAQRVLALLHDAGHQGFLVGGTVRNALLSRPSSDIDVATDARPEKVLQLADHAGIKAVPTGIDHGTMTLVPEGQPVEVTTFRRDVATDGRRATVAFSTDLEEDARRRDFTMNALYAEADGTVVDPLGGLRDLQAGRVRFIDDPEARIREDYLRILRFFRFTAWYGDPAEGIEPEGLAACAGLAEGLARLSAERVTAEIRKLLAAPDPSLAVAAMAQSGILSRVLPGASATALAPLIHAEGTLDLAPDPIVRLASLGGAKEGLRLSRAEDRFLTRLREETASAKAPLELGYRLGRAEALSILALRLAMLGTPVSSTDFSAVERGAQAVFPVRAEHLPDSLQGPQIGAALRRLENLWLTSALQLSRKELLDRL